MLPVCVVGGHHRVVAGVGESVADHRLGRGVVGVRLTEPGLEPLRRVGDLLPVVGIREGVAFEVLAAAGAGECCLVGEVAIDGDPADPGALGDLADRRPGGADRLVQPDRGLDYPLPRLVLALGATLQLIRASHR